MRKLIVLLLFIGVVQTAYTQEEEQEWKSRLHITGYVNTIAEYTDLQNWVDAKHDVGIGLSEAAFLASYKPLKNLEFKGTFVYTHFIDDIQGLLVEAYGTYTISEKLKFSAGKYLAPLSPINQYFYAPLNPSATLPMVVSHHSLIPQSFSGFQVSGEFGTDMKLGYNITYGHYMSKGHPQQGILGIQGMEDFAGYLVDYPGVTKEYLLGGTGRIYGNYNDIINVGFNYFDGKRSTMAVQEMTSPTTRPETFYIPATKNSFGIDMQLKLAGFKLNAEYWQGNLETTELASQIVSEYKGYYGELIYETGIFSPYLRYDYIDDMASALYASFPDNKVFDFSFPTESYTAGIAIRPIFETLIKLEYRHFEMDYLDNPLSIENDSFNHFILSLIYSF